MTFYEEYILNTNNSLDLTGNDNGVYYVAINFSSQTGQDLKSYRDIKTDSALKMVVSNVGEELLPAVTAEIVFERYFE